MVVRNEGGGSLVCPTCRQATPIPPSGVSGLQSAFHINHLLEIQESLKKNKDTEPVVREGASNITTPSKKVPAYCLEHAKKELDLFCETCGKLICLKCAISGGKHHNHVCKEIEEAFERYKEEVTPSLESMKKQMKTIDEALTGLKTRRGEICKQQETIKSDIHNAIGRLHEVLEVRETELTSQLHGMTQGKLKNLAAQEDHLETIQALLNSCSLFLEESLKTGSEEEVLRMKSKVIKQAKELTTRFKADTLKPKTEANMVTSFSADLIGMCQKFGEVHASVLDLWQGHAMSKDAQLSIRAGLPAAIQSTTKKLVRVIGGVKKPFGVALGGRGEVIVSEYEGHCVSIFDCSHAHGKKIQSFGRHGSNEQQFRYPRGLTVDYEGNILVADSVNNRIQKFGLSGLFLRNVNKYLSFSFSGPLNIAFNFVSDIAFNSVNNKIYVLDCNNSRVVVLNSDFSFSSAFGKKGGGSGEFSNPHAIACDGSGEVYVTDTDNHRTQVFSSKGKLLRMFGNRDPTGIAIDANRGLVYVSDSGGHHISVFTSEGQFVSTFGKRGSELGEFNNPNGLAVSTDGILYVCDTKNNRVQCFK